MAGLVDQTMQRLPGKLKQYRAEDVADRLTSVDKTRLAIIERLPAYLEHFRQSWLAENEQLKRGEPTNNIWDGDELTKLLGAKEAIPSAKFFREQLALSAAYEPVKSLLDLVKTRYQGLIYTTITYLLRGTLKRESKEESINEQVVRRVAQRIDRLEESDQAVQNYIVTMGLELEYRDIVRMQFDRLERFGKLFQITSIDFDQELEYIETVLAAVKQLQPPIVPEHGDYVLSLEQWQQCQELLPEDFPDLMSNWYELDDTHQQVFNVTNTLRLLTRFREISWLLFGTTTIDTKSSQWQHVETVVREFGVTKAAIMSEKAGFTDKKEVFGGVREVISNPASHWRTIAMEASMLKQTNALPGEIYSHETIGGIVLSPAHTEIMDLRPLTEILGYNVGDNKPISFINLLDNTFITSDAVETFAKPTMVGGEYYYFPFYRARTTYDVVSYLPTVPAVGVERRSSPGLNLDREYLSYCRKLRLTYYLGTAIRSVQKPENQRDQVDEQLIAAWQWLMTQWQDLAASYGLTYPTYEEGQRFMRVPNIGDMMKPTELPRLPFQRFCNQIMDIRQAADTLALYRKLNVATPGRYQEPQFDYDPEAFISQTQIMVSQFIREVKEILNQVRGTAPPEPAAAASQPVVEDDVPVYTF